jgi:putative spermidine/putrescine transport system substrate-binding protein
MAGKFALIIGLTAACALATAAHSRDLTVVGFGGALQGAMRDSYFQPYSAAAKVALTEESYTGGIAKIKAMVQSGTTSWDVVQMDENEMILACDEGLLEKIDWTSLATAKDIVAPARHACGVGAFVWSMVMAVDSKRGDGVRNWADFWNLEKWPGKRGLRKQARMTLEIALLADGVEPGKIYQTLVTRAGQDRAFQKLEALKPHIQWWESGAQPVEWLASGDVVMTSTYNGRVIAANKQGRNFQMAWGNQLYAMDFWALPKGGKTKEAFGLVNYMTSAEPQKAFAEQIAYGVTNEAATRLIKPAILPLLPTAPENMIGALAVSTPFWVDHEEELQQRFNRWVAQ